MFQDVQPLRAVRYSPVIRIAIIKGSLVSKVNELLTSSRERDDYHNQWRMKMAVNA